MIISRSSRVLFVHVQKTGGSSVDQVLTRWLPDAQRLSGLPGSRHAKMRVALRRYPELHDFFIFGFVRNPWARLLSWHTMIVRRQQQAEAGSDFVAARLAANNFWLRVAREYPRFEEFVLRGTREVPRLSTPQVDWFRSPGRDADLVGRTERLEGDLRRALAAVGLELPDGALGRHNAGEPRSYQGHYTPQMRDRVAEVFAEDIATYGYDF